MMIENDDDIPQAENLDAEVSSDLEEAKELAKSFNMDDIKSGQWFVILLQKVAQSYDRNARSEYFVQKYPGLPPDEIADKLISVTVRYATIAGTVTGAVVTANMITALSSFGMTATLLVGAIGTEMLYLARIQMRLVLDLSVLYDLQLDANDPEDMMMIFGYALGVAPAEMVGKGLQVATRGATEYAVKKYISKGTLKAIQDFGKQIGVRILQKSVIKYTVPFVSAVVGSGFNYLATKTLGGIAKSHISNRGKVTDELRLLVSRQNTYEIAFPAAAMYMAQIDGDFSAKEKEFYRAMLSRMSFDEHTQSEFQKLLKNEGDILEAITQIEDDELKSSLVEVLSLMAIYDGELIESERNFLIKTATQLNVFLDIDEVEKRAQDYRVIVKKNVFHKAANNVKGAATATGSKVSGAFGKVFRRRKGTPAPDVSNMLCSECGNEVSAEHKFCPSCGIELSG